MQAVSGQRSERVTDQPIPQAPDDRLPRRLGLWSAVAILVGSAIGSGIFRVPAGVAARLGDPGAMLTDWVLGGALALAGALTLAELAAALPRSGGIFAYVLEAFGPLPAFLFGWAQLAVLRASSLGAIATIFAEYLGYFIHLTPQGVRNVAAGTLILVGVLNWVGINVAAIVMNVTTAAKFGTLAGLVLLAFLFGDGNLANLAPSGAPVPATAMTTALVSIMWAYDGWADLSFIGGEVKHPGRTMPRALIIGTALIVAIYLAINAAYLYLVPAADMAQSKLVAATAAERIPLIGRAGASVVAAMVMLSCFGACNGSMITGPRVFFAMADRGLFFRWVARVSPRFQTPSAAIWLACGLGVFYVLQNDFQQLADRFVLGVWPFYALAVAGVFVLRRRQPDLPRPYRALGYPVVPFLFLVGSVGMVVNALVTDPGGTGVTFLIILAGVPVYFVWKRRAAGRGAGA